MKNNLTKKEIALMHTVREEWLDFIFSCKNSLDQVAATDGIKYIYTKLLGIDMPKIEFVDSPQAAQDLANKLNNTVNKKYSIAYYGNLWDSGWCSFYDFFTRIGEINFDKFNNYLKYVKSGVFSSIFFDEVAILVDLPVSISRDNRNRLHNEDGPAITFKDGYSQFYWKGTAVTEKIILNPESITKEDLNRVQDRSNLEMRRIFIEILGATNYFKILSGGEGLRTLDTDTDDQGFPMSLMEFDFEDEKIQVLEVTCPSTKRIYNIYPPSQNCTNVWDAKADTFNKEKLTYRHGDVGLVGLNLNDGELIAET